MRKYNIELKWNWELEAESADDAYNEAERMILEDSWLAIGLDFDVEEIED